MVNYYHDMWPHRAHILTPLTEKMGAPKKGTKQSKFIWMEAMQAVFKQMKVLMAVDVICALSKSQPHLQHLYRCFGLPTWTVHYATEEISSLLRQEAQQCSMQLIHDGQGTSINCHDLEGI
jgi:hypothetical protein